MVVSLQYDESLKVVYNTCSLCHLYCLLSVYKLAFWLVYQDFLLLSEFGISVLLNPLRLLKSHFNNLC